MRRENLQQTYDPEMGHDGSGHERAYAQCATDFRIDTRIVSRVLARDEVATANAFSRETLFYVHRRSEQRGCFTGSRPADHLVIREKRQSRATGSGEAQGALGDQLQNCIDVLVTNLADLAANCFQRRSLPLRSGIGTTSGASVTGTLICEHSET